jgi:hypothetical protein
MDIGGAVAALREGKRVATSAMRGYGAWLVLVPGSTITVAADRPLGIAAPELVGAVVDYCAHIDIHGADGSIQPWGGATLQHLLADDWEVLD